MNIESDKNIIENNEEDEESWYEKENKKTENIIKNYNIGTLKMFISPEILSMTSKERKKIEKIYYKREYTETPSDILKTQKEVALQEKQKLPQVEVAVPGAANVPNVAALPPTQVAQIKQEMPLKQINQARSGVNTANNLAKMLSQGSMSGLSNSLGQLTQGAKPMELVTAVRGNQNPFVFTAQQPIQNTKPDLTALAELLKQG